jgi:Transposase
VVAAWQGKELLRAVYAAGDLADARAALERFYRWCDGVGVPELSRLARTVRAWEAEILAFHSTQGCSNGPTEAINLLIKKVKRVGHGFRSFPNHQRDRLKVGTGGRYDSRARDGPAPRTADGPASMGRVTTPGRARYSMPQVCPKLMTACLEPLHPLTTGRATSGLALRPWPQARSNSSVPGCGSSSPAQEFGLG